MRGRSTDIGAERLGGRPPSTRGDLVLSRLLALLGALPVGVERTVALALGRAVPRTSADRSASRVVPVVIGALMLLGLVPLLFAGLELVIHRTSAKDLVDRVTGPSTQLVELSGLAQLPPFPAPPRADGTPSGYYLLRDSAAARDVVVVRSDLPAAALLTREIIAVIVDDRERVAADAAALSGRGVTVDAAALGERYLREEPDASDAQATTLAELATRPVGSTVRLRVRFTAAAVPGCGSSGDAACDARTLAAGRASFDHLTADPGSGAPLIVRTDYPASLAPMRVFGTQELDRSPIDALYTRPAATALGTWARELRTAWIDRDPGLPVDRPWFAPALLISVALLLAIGRRIGYPVFRSTDSTATARPVRHADAPTPVASSIPVVVAGHLSRPAGGPIDVHGARGHLITGGSGVVAELEAETHGGLVRTAITQAMRGVSAVEPGDLVHVRGREPALALHWFGNDVVLAFGSDADRDRAASVLAG